MCPNPDQTFELEQTMDSKYEVQNLVNWEDHKDSGILLFASEKPMTYKRLNELEAFPTKHLQLMSRQRLNCMGCQGEHESMIGAWHTMPFTVNQFQAGGVSILQFRPYKQSLPPPCHLSMLAPIAGLLRLQSTSSVGGGTRAGRQCLLSVGSGQGMVLYNVI